MSQSWWTQNGFTDPIGSNIDELREADSWDDAEEDQEAIIEREWKGIFDVLRALVSTPIVINNDLEKK